MVSGNMRSLCCDLKHKMSPSDTLCFKKNIGGAVVRCLLQELRPKGGCSFYCAGPSSCRAAFTDALCVVNYYPGSDLRREHQRWAGAPGRAPFGAPSSGDGPRCASWPRLHLLTLFPSILYLVPLYASNGGCRPKEAVLIQKGFLVRQ